MAAFYCAVCGGGDAAAVERAPNIVMQISGEEEEEPLSCEQSEVLGWSVRLLEVEEVSLQQHSITLGSLWPNERT